MEHRSKIDLRLPVFHHSSSVDDLQHTDGISEVLSCWSSGKPLVPFGLLKSKTYT